MNKPIEFFRDSKGIYWPIPEEQLEESPPYKPHVHRDHYGNRLEEGYDSPEDCWNRDEHYG